MGDGYNFTLRGVPVWDAGAGGCGGRPLLDLGGTNR